MHPTTQSIDLRVHGDRLIAEIRALARIGATTAGGVSRTAYSDDDLAARAAVREMMRAAGLDVRVDAAGNSLGARAGSGGDLPPLMIGSHTDTVPDGGRYDGALGVLAAIEVARLLHEHNLMLRHPLFVLEVDDFQRMLQ